MFVPELQFYVKYGIILVDSKVSKKIKEEKNMWKRYAILFLGGLLSFMSLALAIVGSSLAWVTAFLGIACVVMGAISVFSYKKPETTETENTEDKEKPKPRKTKKTDFLETETLDGYRKKVASWNVK